LGGCESPAARARLQKRLTSLHNTAETFAGSEAGRPAKTQRDLTYVVDSERRRARQLRDNAEWFGDLSEREVRRFESRQDEYRATIERLFRGKPERIADNAVILFY
ncbi:MAG: hypothetical protein AB1716_09700, partial [Planctomycetota bacterium]